MSHTLHPARTGDLQPPPPGRPGASGFLRVGSVVPARSVGRSLVAGLCVAAIFSLGGVGAARSQGDAPITLIPEAEVPRGPPRDAEDARLRSTELVRKYPHDPRARMDRAGALLLTMDVSGAERELRAGLAEEKALTQLNPAVGRLLQATLAKVLLVQQRRDEALAIARPLCQGDAYFRGEVAKVGLCPELVPGGQRKPGDLDPARMAAIAQAASKLQTLVHDGRPPHASDPVAGALLDTVLDVSTLAREVPPMSQMAGVAQWMVMVGNVCGMYDLSAAPEAARERMHDYADEIGRCADALLTTSSTVLAATASAPPEFHGVIMAMKPSPQQMVVQSVRVVLAMVNRPDPTDGWRRARLPALAAFAARTSPLLSADERGPLAASLESASRGARDPELRAGLMSVAGRLADK
jgi:hypothetical protein